MARTWAPAEAPSYGWEPGMLSLKAEASKLTQGPVEAADALNAQTVIRPVAVSSRVALSILLKTGDWGRLKLYSRRIPLTEEEGSLIAAAITAVDAVEHTDALGTELEEDAAVIGNMMLTFVGAGLMQETTRQRLVALMTQSFPVWDPPVTPEDVRVSRELADG